jgi:excisionase family DNA binding protein
VPDEFMTVAEVAEILKLNQQTVRNWIDSGFLPALRIGRRVRIKRSDFNALLGASYSGPKKAAPAANIWEGDVPRPETREGEVPPPEVSGD